MNAEERMIELKMTDRKILENIRLPRIELARLILEAEEGLILRQELQAVRKELQGVLAGESADKSQSLTHFKQLVADLRQHNARLTQENVEVKDEVHRLNRLLSMKNSRTSKRITRRRKK